MQAGDLEVLKAIPGYKIILKTVLKSQIQQLVEQLADHTGEESVILTASVSDGSLSHLGSESGKVFIEDHDDIKSRFLGFCLKRHHKQKQQEKQQELSFETNERLRNTPSTGTYLPGRPRHRITPASPTIPFNSQFSSQDVHPVSLTRNSQQNPLGTNVRHKPYLINRPTKASKQAQPATTKTLPSETNDAEQIRLNPNEVIKIEAIEEDDESQSDAKSDKSEASNQSASRKSHSSQSNVATGSLPSEIPMSSTSSSFTIHTSAKGEQGSEFASSELSETSDKSTKRQMLDINTVNSTLGGASTDDSNVDTDLGMSEFENTNRAVAVTNQEPTVKVEPVSEAEMDLEIIGVEPGQMAQRDSEWMQHVQTTMGFGGSDSGVSQGNSAEGDEQFGVRGKTGSEGVRTIPKITDTGMVAGLSRKSYKCSDCGKSWRSRAKLEVHRRVHTGERPFFCEYCGRTFTQKGHMRSHVLGHVIAEGQKP